MTGERTLAHWIDRSVGTVIDCQSAPELRSVVCTVIAELVDAPCAVLEWTGTASRELARSAAAGEWDPSAAAGESDPAAATGEPCTTLDIPGTEPRTVLVVGTAIDAELHRPVWLILNVALTTAERIAGDDRVRASRSQLRRLGAQIQQLESTEPGSATETGSSADFAAAAALLTEREREILADLVRGESNAAIADQHTVSVETVKTHVKHILQKMGAANRAELIARAR